MSNINRFAQPKFAFLSMVNKQHYVVLIWLVVNLITAGMSELHPDEAYYWMYSRFPDWGYFDHPPMISIMTLLGYYVFPTELGVRLMAVLSTAGALFIIRSYNLKFKQTGGMAYALVIFSIVSLSTLGFTNTPDSYLLLFTSLYLLCYKKYLDGNSSWSVTLIWGFSMAAMLYSKYHGILVIGFTALSNPKILQKRTFWLAGILGLILFLPHLWWQYSHDFPSVKYHLIDRSKSGYQLKYTLEYILGQLFYYGPITGFVMYYFTIKARPEDRFEKGLKFIFYGFLIFFMIMTFQGRIEANWTVVILIPFIYFTIKEIKTDKSNNYRLFSYFAYPSILLLLVVRVHILFPLFDFDGDRTNELRGHHEFAENAIKKSKGLPLVANKYQTASILSYYTENLVTSLNVSSRKNQYDFWNFDQKLADKRVYFINSHLDIGDNLTDGMGNSYRGTKVNQLTILRGVFPELDYNTELGLYVLFNLSEDYGVTLGSKIISLQLKDAENSMDEIIHRVNISTGDIRNGKRINLKIDPGLIRGKSIYLDVVSPELGIWGRTPEFKME